MKLRPNNDTKIISMTLNMTTQSCIIRLRNIVVPICLMIMQRHLFTCLISQKKFQNTV